MIFNLLNSELTLYRATYTADGAGGRIKTMTSRGTLRAKVNQPSSQERMIAGQFGADLSHVVHVAYGADVERGDELDIGEPRRVRVRAVLSDSQRTYKRLECEVVQGG